MLKADSASHLAYPYFISYMLIVLFVMINLVMAVILQNFSSLSDVNPSFASVSDIEEFNARWNEIDVDDTGFMQSEHLPELLVRLERPLRPFGVPFERGEVSNAALVTTRKRVDDLIAEGMLPNKMRHGYLEYKFVLEELINFTYVEYNRLHPDEQIEAPMHFEKANSSALAGGTSKWFKAKRHRMASFVHARNSTTELKGTGPMTQMIKALLRDGALGRGPHAKQLRSLTEVLTRQASMMDEQADELSLLYNRVNDLERTNAELKRESERWSQSAPS
jgi:hypothetical protein